MFRHEPAVSVQGGAVQRMGGWFARLLGQGGWGRIPRPNPVRGVHWFAQHDPLSFWECFDEAETLGQFRQIRQDGFNSVFLLIPWHAFFPDEDDRPSAWMVSRLHSVLGAARRSRLAVFGRLFYQHSYLRNEKELSHERQYRLLMDPDAGVLLGEQARALAESVRGAPAWVGEFVCWEDFWAIFHGPPGWDRDRRRETAARSGFAQWMALREGAGVSPEHGEFPPLIEVPEHGTDGMRHWIDFFAKVLRERVIAPIEKSFPQVGLEVRIDGYPIPRSDGLFRWEPFDLHQDLGPRRLTYWGAYFCQRNEGESLSSAQALSGLSAALDLFPGDTPLVLDQFNFQDTSLEFAGRHASIHPSAIPEFIGAAGQLMSERRWGYAIWAWQDYRENWVSNAGFQQGAKDWQASPASTLVSAKGRGAVLGVGASISQRIVPRVRTDHPPDKHSGFFCEVHLDRRIGDAHAITLSVDGEPLAVARECLGPEGRSVRWALPADRIRLAKAWNEGFYLTLGNQGLPARTAIVRVHVWGFTQSLGVRGTDGRPGPYWDAMRALNARAFPSNESRSS